MKQEGHTMRQVLVIDDLRSFRDVPTDTDVTYARTSKAGLEVLARGTAWDEIWLDHDLGEDMHGVIDSIMPVVDVMSERAFNDQPVVVGRVYVHTSNPPASNQMMTTLTRFGYPVERVQAERFFTV